MNVYWIEPGSVDVSVVLRAVDSTDGTPETAFDHATAGIDLKYRREGAANVDITEAALAALTTAHTDGGVEQIGNGYFRLDLPDAAVATGVDGVMVHGVATGMVIMGCYIHLRRMPADVRQFGGSNGTFASGVPAVNATQVSGDSTAADNLETAFDDTAGAVPYVGIIDQGTAQSATATTLVLRAAAAFADDTLIGATLMAFGSTQGYWQSRTITDNTLADDTVTVDTWTVTPSGTITYKIFAGPPASSTVVPAVNVTQFGGTNGTFSGGRPEVNTTHVAGTSQTAGDIIGDTNDIQARLPAALVSGRIDASVGAMAANVLTATAIAADAITAAKVADGTIDAATFAAGAINAAAIAADAIGASELAADAVAEIADAIWDEEITVGHTTADSAGAKLNSAGGAADPWATALPGAYGAGTAGKIIGDNVNATISSRATQTSVDTIDDFVDTEVSAIKAKTDNLPANPAAVSDIPTAAAITTAVLTTAMTEAYAADGAAPTLAQALFMLLGKNYEFAISGDTLTVKKLDGSTSAMTFTLAPAGGPYTSITRAS